VVAGLVNESEGAARQAVVAVFIQSDDLHGICRVAGVLFELAQDGPTSIVRQEMSSEIAVGRCARASAQRNLRRAARPTL